MSARRAMLVAGALLVVAVAIWAVSLAVERAVRPPQPDPLPPATERPVEPTPYITATLFYGGPDGDSLVPHRREVPLGNDIVAQGHAILAAQFEPAPEPYISVIPEGTALRAFYVTARGDAFVDVTPEIRTAHPGGSTMELLTVYAVVNAITANLPDVQRVQILVDGQEVDTIAGHVDVRRPLARNVSLVHVPSEAP